MKYNVYGGFSLASSLETSITCINRYIDDIHINGACQGQGSLPPHPTPPP